MNKYNENRKTDFSAAYGFPTMIEYSLKSNNFRHEILMYFKSYNIDDYHKEMFYGQNYGITKDSVLNDFFVPEFLDEYYSAVPLKLKNGKKFLYGKVTASHFYDKNDRLKLKLELFYINSNNMEEKEIYYKNCKLYDLLFKYNESQIQNEIGMSYFRKDMVTLFTRYKNLHKTSNHLDGMEKEIYNIIMDAFKDKIPKEYFEYRDKIYPQEKWLEEYYKKHVNGENFEPYYDYKFWNEQSD